MLSKGQWDDFAAEVSALLEGNAPQQEEIETLRGKLKYANSELRKLREEVDDRARRDRQEYARRETYEVAESAAVHRAAKEAAFWRWKFNGSDPHNPENPDHIAFLEAHDLGIGH